MNNFRERIGRLTVGEAITLNAASKIIRKYNNQKEVSNGKNEKR